MTSTGFRHGTLGHALRICPIVRQMAVSVRRRDKADYVNADGTPQQHFADWAAGTYYRLGGGIFGLGTPDAAVARAVRDLAWDGA